MIIRPVGNVLFHTDGRTDILDEGDSRFSQFCERAKKNDRLKLPENFMYDLCNSDSWFLSMSN
jgi:hypothetical protein